MVAHLKDGTVDIENLYASVDFLGSRFWSDMGNLWKSQKNNNAMNGMPPVFHSFFSFPMFSSSSCGDTADRWWRSWRPWKKTLPRWSDFGGASAGRVSRNGALRHLSACHWSSTEILKTVLNLRNFVNPNFLKTVLNQCFIYISIYNYIYILNWPGLTGPYWAPLNPEVWNPFFVTMWSCPLAHKTWLRGLMMWQTERHKHSQIYKKWLV